MNIRVFYSTRGLPSKIDEFWSQGCCSVLLLGSIFSTCSTVRIKVHGRSWTLLFIFSFHKYVFLAPGRPMVSDLKSLLYNCCSQIQLFLSAIVTVQDSYSRDSAHLVAILRQFPHKQPCIIFTMDVKSLYTNIPLQATIQIIRDLFRNHPDPLRPNRTLLIVLELSLKPFNHARFLQKRREEILRFLG